MALAAAEIRKRFIAYFEARTHRTMPSSSLVPHKDPTVLLTTAGMMPFKPYFMGLETPPATRLTSIQKCFRTTDLDQVGRTARHHTFFEMLGNFSFGDYFKAEVIPWAWAFLTEELGLPRERLWVTVYKDDDEAESIWHKTCGIPMERIVRLGDDTNFWAAGPTGPCGPCSEIYYDHEPDQPASAERFEEDSDRGRFLEVWNLVFMQYERLADGTMRDLPARNIDTGMGLERIASVLQGVSSNYETDLLMPLMQAVAERAGRPVDLTGETGVAFRRIADHARASTFLVADGVVPGNEGRGYVLRRILRRAIRHGRQLGITGAFVRDLAIRVISAYGHHYGELVEKQATILEVLEAEEARFGTTLDRGLLLFEKAIGRLEGSTLSGATAFELFDTYGFPVELTAELAAERGLEVDRAGFDAAMDEQRQRARDAHAKAGITYGGLAIGQHPPTQFVGYDATETRARVLEIVEGDSGAIIVLDRSPFYAEGGGQVGDQGTLAGLRVVDTQKQGDVHVHHVAATEGLPGVGDVVDAVVDDARRKATMRHHTATHLLHAGLHAVLGPTATQAGSYVGPDELRFDFQWSRAMTAEEVMAVEDWVNQAILTASRVNRAEMSMAEARAKGAVAMFGEKYGEQVRVIEVPGLSTELCGGTHATSTGEIGYLKITEEKGIAAGVRRIRAVAGMAAVHWVRQQAEVVDILRDGFKVSVEALPERVQKLRDQVRAAEDAAQDLRAQLAVSRASSLASDFVEVAGLQVLAARLDGCDGAALRTSAIDLGKGGQPRVVLLAGVSADRIQAVLVANSEAVARGVHAGQLLGQVLTPIGGKGGGKPDAAQGGGGDAGLLEEALANFGTLLAGRLAPAGA
ncbi:MAG: alanine--tRNA ligase [Candidatus Sericytochromatia bacterium]|nr:alanine--tRNA ligase [Candidatus Sericytochromatia bacterium]